MPVAIDQLAGGDRLRSAVDSTGQFNRNTHQLQGKALWAIPAALRLAPLDTAEPTAPDRPRHKKARAVKPGQEE